MSFEHAAMVEVRFRYPALCKSEQFEVHRASGIKNESGASALVKLVFDHALSYQPKAAFFTVLVSGNYPDQFAANLIELHNSYVKLRISRSDKAHGKQWSSPIGIDVMLIK